MAQIEAFLAVARSGGFSTAAKARGAAPSSITRSVAALEDALGVRLFERTTRNVRLTAAGDAFLARASAALE
ncbi:MAG: LysR family transcriptional regulator, partial [Pseudomonadota bacterium]